MINLNGLTYQQSIDYLYNLQPPFHIVGAQAYKPGFDNILALMHHLGNPHRVLKTIHVAGTNGKGSTSNLIAAILQSAGYKVGLFTSPHLVDFRERIRIDGQMISEQEVIDFISENQSILENIKPSFFETTTAMAFNYFVKQQVDVAVIEVGLGGRLDSTNIITPDLSVITNIGFDHTQFLGDTLQQIATEKAGIIKHQIPVVIGETNDVISPVFIAKATENDAPIFFAQQYQQVPDYDSQLIGEFQNCNKQAVYTAVNILMQKGYQITDDAIQRGFANVCTLTGLRGRWEILQNQPLVVCDTGHNSHAFRYFKQQLNKHTYKRLFIVIGMVDDKDVDDVMSLLPASAEYIFVQANTKRAIPSEQLKQMAESHRLCGIAIQNVVEAYQYVRNLASAEDMIFIGGSNYVVGEFLQWHNICDK